MREVPRSTLPEGGNDEVRPVDAIRGGGLERQQHGGLAAAGHQEEYRLAITDGPFPEAKEFLAGFWIVDVDSPKHALDIAARLSSLPGRGGAPANIPIEVRPIMEGMSGDV